MCFTLHAGLLAGTAALTLASVGAAGPATDAATDDLRAQIQQLQARIAELEARQGDHWLTEKRAAEIRALVHDVLADADTRASLLSSGMTAGWDDGFVIGDTAGDFLLRINGQLQARLVYSNQRHDAGFASPPTHFLFQTGGLPLAEAFWLGFDDIAHLLATHPGGPYGTFAAFIADQYGMTMDQFTAAWLADLHHPAFIDPLTGLSLWQQAHDPMGLTPSGFHFSHMNGIFPNLAIGTQGDRNRSGFENTRTKLWFTGHVVNPNWLYHIEADFGAAGGAFLLRDAWLAHDYGNGFRMTAGQFTLPFLGEQLIDARYQQAVERSLVHSYFTAGRSQGFMGSFEGDMFRVWAAFSDGQHQANSPWFRGPEMGSTEWAVTARGEVKFAGTWDQFSKFRSEPGEPYGGRIGAAIHAQDGEYGTAAFTSETFIIAATADLLVKMGGGSVYAAGKYRRVDVNNGGRLNQWGALVQGGYHITPAWEAFLRYEFADLDLPDLTVLGVPVYSFDNLHLLTWGVNHYMLNAGHQAKLTADMGYAFHRVEVTDLRTGWRSDFGGRRGQFVLRTQLQLAF